MRHYKGILLGVVLFLLTVRCSPLKAIPNHGVYQKTIILHITDDCKISEGYHTPSDPVYICIATHNFNDWQDIWADEADHLFRDMTGMEQPESYLIKR